MMDNFKGIKYFKATSTTDQWGDPSKMSRELLLRIDELRELTKRPIYVTSGYRAQDKSSQHSKGLAVDIVCPDITLLDFYLLAEKVGFDGLGIYPHWRYGEKTTGGLHVDLREAPRARWMGIKTGANKQTYIALSHMNLKASGVI